MLALRLFFAVLTVIIAGLGILKLIDRNGKHFSGAIERASIAYMLGLGAIVYAQLLCIFLRIPVTFGVIMMIAAVSWLTWLSQVVGRRGAPAGIGAFFTRTRRVFVDFTAVEAVVLAAILLFIVIMCAMCVLVPKYTWDSRATWGLTAKIIYFDGTIFTRDFLDPNRYHPSPFYPLFIPLAENFFYHILGGVNEYLVKSLYALMYASAAGILYVALRKYFFVRRLIALSAVLVAASIPSLFVIYSGSVPSAYADYPLGCAYLFTLVYLFQYIRGRERVHVWLAAVFLAMVLFTKNEGMPLAMLAAGVFVFDTIKFAKTRSRATYSALLVFIAAPLAALLPWFMIKRSLVVHVQWYSVWGRGLTVLKEQIHLVPHILGLTFKHMYTNFESWGFVWFFISIALFLFPGRKLPSADRRVLAYCLIIPNVYYFLVITLIYCTLWYGQTIPVDNEFQGGSFERLRFHALWPMVLYAAVAIDAFFRSTSPRMNSAQLSEKHDRKE